MSELLTALNKFGTVPLRKDAPKKSKYPHPLVVRDKIFEILMNNSLIEAQPLLHDYLVSHDLHCKVVMLENHGIIDINVHWYEFPQEWRDMGFEPFQF